MEAQQMKLSDITIEEFKKMLKEAVHDCFIDEMETVKETIEIESNMKIMNDLKQADRDWQSEEQSSYVEWDKIKCV